MASDLPDGPTLGDTMTATTLLHGTGWFLLASWLLFALRIAADAAKLHGEERAAALRRTLTNLLWMALPCAFLGVVVFTIGLGAIFPKLLLIGAPLSCAGHVELLSQNYFVPPAQHSTIRNFYCLLESGERKTVTGLTIACAGLVYSALLMTLLMWRKVYRG